MRLLHTGNLAGWGMVAICWAAQNSSMGLAFGSFGPLLSSTEEHFGVSRTISTLGMSVITLAIGILSPLCGRIMAHMPVRNAMICASLVSAAGYWGLALLPSFTLALLMYALIGAGISVMSLLGPLTIVNRWFVGNRGQMLGLINLPIVLVALPYLLAEMLPRFGRVAILGGLGAVFLALVPLLMCIVESPDRLNKPPSHRKRAPNENDNQSRTWGGVAAGLFKSPQFWFLSLGAGIGSASATAFVVHIVPFGMGEGASFKTASGLLSVYAMAGLVGTLLFGWISDRLGAPLTLTLAAIIQAFLWWGLLHATGPVLYMIAAMLGTCAVPINVLHGAAISEIVKPDEVSNALGFSYALKLPFLFSFPPLVSLLFDHSGGYWLPFVATSGALALAACLFLLIVISGRQDRTAVHAL